MNQTDYRTIAEKDALDFAMFLCLQNVNLSITNQFLIFIENDGSIKKTDPRGLWPEEVELPTDLLSRLRGAGLVGSVLLSALPEDQGNIYGIEIQVEDANFYPQLPNPAASLYSSVGYVDADGKFVQIPRESHPGRYYFPSVIAL